MKKYLPIAFVEDKEVRNFCKYDINIGQKTIIEVIFKLVKLVEIEISQELKGTIGAILFDEWTRNSIHYVTVFCHIVLVQAALGIHAKRS